METLTLSTAALKSLVPGSEQESANIVFKYKHESSL